MFAQGGDDHSQELLPVIRIHMDLLRVLLAQLGVSILDVVQVLHSSVQPTHHCLAVSGHLFVCDDGGVGGNVAEACEVSLSPWVDDQKGLPGQSLGSDLTHIDLPPQGYDGSALSICPLDHVDGVKVSSDF
uniref:Uncharacterized protein n=1 Tax=Sparus aurata TaxID=8175 RepID=A0A671UR41_SPAAU